MAEEIDPETRAQLEEEWPRDANYVLWYPKDLKLPPGTPGNVKARGFRWKLPAYWFLLTNAHAQAALRAGRMLLLTIGKDGKRRPNGSNP